MPQSKASSSIAFAVFKRETLADQIVNQAVNFGAISNRLTSRFIFLSVPREFIKSRRIFNLMQKHNLVPEYKDIIFTDWLSSTSIDFIKSSSDFLLVLDACIALPGSFEKWLVELVSEFPKSLDAISICPTHPSAEELVTGTTEPMKTSVGINSLGFVFTREAARKFIKTFDQTPSGDFQKLIEVSKIACGSILDSSQNQPVYFLDVHESQNAYQGQFNLSPPNLFPPENEVVKELSLGGVKVQAFISHWFSTWDNIDAVERACLEHGYDTTVLNTTILGKEGWDNEIPISFFRQFEYACYNYDPINEYMLFITADVKSDKWLEFFSYADKVLRLQGIGTFSPTLTAAMTDQGWQVPFLYFDPESSTKIPFHNDVIVTYIHRRVVEEFKLFLHYFNNHSDTFHPTVGWGPDPIIRVLMYHLDLLSVRDRTFTLMHPWTTSYDPNIARLDEFKIRQIADEFFALNGQEKISVIEQKIMESVNKERYKILVEKINKIV
jgi:hypothetical protein